MIFTKQQYLTIYIFEFLMNRNFTNEICLSKLPIFTFIPCSYPYPTRTRFPSTRTLPVPVSLLPVPYPYPSTSYPYPGSGTGTRPAGCSTLVGRYSVLGVYKQVSSKQSSNTKILYNDILLSLMSCRYICSQYIRIFRSFFRKCL